MQAFVSKPLAPIKLENYVSYLTRSQVGQPPVSTTLPFDVSGDRSSQTHCSQATIRRVTDNVLKYAKRPKGEVGNNTDSNRVTPAGIDTLNHSPAALLTATGHLGKLFKAPNQAMEFDRTSLWNLMKQALGIATSDERGDTPKAEGPNGEINFLRFRLGQVGEREPASWFELLVVSILSSASEHDIHSLYPYMSSMACTRLSLV